MIANLHRVAKFDPKVGSRRTTKITNLVVLIIILVVLIFGALLYVCGTSSHTAVFIGKRKTSLWSVLYRDAT